MPEKKVDAIPGNSQTDQTTAPNPDNKIQAKARPPRKPALDPSVPGYMRGGFRPRKYIVTKADGTPTDPKAVYFVLRLDEDPHAIAATLAYADSVRADNPDLARDLKSVVERLQAATELKHLIGCCLKLKQNCAGGGVGSIADGLWLAMEDLIKEAELILGIMEQG